MAVTLVYEPHEFEVLETIDYVEESSRDASRRFYTLGQQTDDLIRSSLPEGRVFRMQLHAAQREAELAKSLLQLGVKYSATELPKPRRVVKEPLADASRFQSWMVPTVAGRDLLRDSELASNESMLVIDSSANRPQPTSYAQAVVGMLDSVKVVVPPTNADIDAVLTPADIRAPLRVTYEGVHIVKKGKNEEAKSINKQTFLLPAFKFWQSLPMQGNHVKLEPVDVYPAEQLPIKGWMLLPFEGDQADPIVDPPSTQIWFQKAPVVLTTYKDIFALRPSLQDVLNNRPEDASKLADYLLYWGLTVRDIPADVYEKTFPQHELPASLATDDSREPINVAKQAQPVDVATVGYDPHEPALDPYTWLNSQLDGGHLLRLQKLLKALDNLPRMSTRVPAPLRLPEDQPKTTSEECMNDALKSYGMFVKTGVYRHTSQQCVPVAVAQREQEVRLFDGRVGKPAALTALKEQVKVLQDALQRKTSKLATTVVLVEGQDQPLSSEQRQVIAILTDPSLSNDARFGKLQALLDGLQTERTGRLRFYRGKYLLCDHTLDWLQNAESDAERLWQEWAVPVEGRYVCQHCGEEMGTVLGMEGFDDEGHLLQGVSEIDGEGAAAALPVGPADGWQAYSDLLAGSREGVMILQFLHSLGVEPQLAWLTSFYSFLLRVNDKFVGKSSSDASRGAMRDLLGVAWMVFLFKMHPGTPLRPRRNLSRQPFSLAGFPLSRGDTDTKEAPLVDFIIGCLGSIARMDPRNRTREARNPLYKAVLDNPKNFKEKLLTLLQKISLEVPPEALFVDPDTDVTDVAKSAPARLPTMLVKHRHALVYGLPYERRPMMQVSRSTLSQKAVHDMAATDEAEAPCDIRTKELRPLVGSKAGKALQEQEPPTSKARIELRRPDLPASELMLFSYKATVAVLQYLVGTGLGRASHGWVASQPRQTFGDIATMTMRANEYRSRLPVLEAIGKHQTMLEDLVRVAAGVKNDDARLDIATWCLQTAVDILTDVFGKTLINDLLKQAVELETGIYSFTTAQIKDRVQRARAIERRTVDQRFGAMTDAQRDIDKQLRDMGILPRSIVDVGDRAEIAAIVDAPDAQPLSLVGYTDDDYEDDQYVDRGDYGDLQESHEAYDD